MTIFTWIITILAIIGVMLNIYKIRFCFVIWTITNISWMIVDYMAGIYAQSALFAVYAALAIWGLIRWSKNKG